MRKIAFIVVLAGLGAGGFALAATTTVTLSPTGPQPATVTVGWGDTVSFVNGDSASHVVRIPRLEASSAALEPGASFAQVFDGRGGNYVFQQIGRPNYGGLVVVEVKGKVTLSTATPAIDYGRSVTLRGTSSIVNTPVSIVQRKPGESADFTEAAKVQADDGGRFSVTVRPREPVLYRATIAADQIRSQSVQVAIRPRVKASASPRSAAVGRKVTITARVTPPAATSHADLERWDPRRKDWAREAQKPVGRAGRARFAWKTLKGSTRLRVRLRRSSLEPGWEEASSPAFVVTGR